MSEQQSGKLVRFNATEENGFAADCWFGFTSSPNGESGTVYAIFNKKDIDPELIEQYKDDEEYNLATALTGWQAYSHGVGRGFACDPSFRIVRTRIIVKQFRGLDI